MFTKLNKGLLNISLNKAGIRDKVEAGNAMEIFEKKITEKMGKGVLDYVAPLYIKNKTLTIKIADSLLAVEIKKIEEDILNEIKQTCEIEIKRIRFLG